MAVALPMTARFPDRLQAPLEFAARLAAGPKK